MKAVPRITPKVWATLAALLKQDWSPEQISGRLKNEQAIGVSHEWIYHHVLLDKQAGGTLYKQLRCQKQRRKRYGSYDRWGKLPNCGSIEVRPAIVNARKLLGDWEVDTLLGSKCKDVMFTLTERKSRYVLVGKVKDRTAQAVQSQICTLLLPQKDKVHTITSDHGKELVNHEQIARILDLNSILHILTPLGNAVPTKTQMVCYDRISQRNPISAPCPTRSLFELCQN